MATSKARTVRIALTARSQVLRRIISAPLTVSAVVLLIWGGWYLLFFAQGHDPRDLILVSDEAILHSTMSSVIRIDPTYHYHAGYDGEFAYFLALDPAHAAGYLDKPIYRYTRILYPMMARLLALGQPQWIPWTLILVNLLAMTLGTLVVASWLQRKGYSPWFGLLFGMSPGLVIGMQYDLNEPTAIALAAAGMALLTWEEQRRLRHWWLAGLAFAAAALAREVTLIIPACVALTTLLRPRHVGDRRIALQFAALVFSPFLLYRLFLTWWLGPSLHSAVPSDVLPALPLTAYLAPHTRFPFVPIVDVVTVVLPALVVLLLAIPASWKARWGDGLLLALILQIVYFVVLTPSVWLDDILGLPRVAAMIPVATLFCLPQLDGQARHHRLWLAATCTLWTLLLPWLLTNWRYW